MKDPFAGKPLSFGQVVYAITGSTQPNEVTIDQLRYLRRLGIPFSPEEAKGSGNRMAYTFDHLFECGVAIVALGFLKPRDVQEIIVGHRTQFRKVGRDTLALLGKGWATILDRYEPDGAHRDDRRLVLTDRYSDDPCNFYLMGGSDGRKSEVPVHSTHRLPHTAQITGRHIALKSLVAMLVFRALQAPETKPGRQ